MYKILKAEQLTANIFLMDVEAPRVARHCEPGQFVIVKMDEKGERIPLTICDYDREAGTITIVFQPVGASTTQVVPVPVSVHHIPIKSRRLFPRFHRSVGKCFRTRRGRYRRTEEEKDPVCRRRCRSSTCISTGEMAP